MERNKRFEKITDLAMDIMDMNSCLHNAELKVEYYRLTAASYKAEAFKMYELQTKLHNQIAENHNAEYHMGSSNSTYRTLEDMRDCGLLSEDEYEFCNII